MEKGEYSWEWQSWFVFKGQELQTKENNSFLEKEAEDKQASTSWILREKPEGERRQKGYLRGGEQLLHLVQFGEDMTHTRELYSSIPGDFNKDLNPFTVDPLPYL